MDKRTWLVSVNTADSRPGASLRFGRGGRFWKAARFRLAIDGATRGTFGGGRGERPPKSGCNLDRTGVGHSSMIESRETIVSRLSILHEFRRTLFAVLIGAADLCGLS